MFLGRLRKMTLLITAWRKDLLYELESSSHTYTPSQSRASAKKGSSDRGVSEYSERPKNRLFQADKDLRSCDWGRTCKRDRHPERWSRPGDPGRKGSVSP